MKGVRNMGEILCGYIDVFEYDEHDEAIDLARQTLENLATINIMQLI